MASHYGYLLLAACLLLRSGSWGFHFRGNREAFPPKPAKHSLLTEKWTSSSRDLVSPSALFRPDSDITEGEAGDTADDDDLHEAIEDMASFISLRAGIIILRQLKQQKEQVLLQEATHIKEMQLQLSMNELEALENRRIDRANKLRATWKATEREVAEKLEKKKEKEQALIQEVSHTKEKQLQLPVNELEALESTDEYIRVAEANKLEATWKAAERAVVKNIRMGRHCVLYSSVGTTPVAEHLAWSTIADMDGERHSLQNKKEGDPSSNATAKAVLLSTADDDDVLTAAPSNYSTTNTSDLGDAVLGMFSEIVKDGSCLLLKAAESTMSQTLQWTLSSIKYASQSTSTQSPVANQDVPERAIGSASAVPTTVTHNDSATYTTVKSDNYSPLGEDPSIAPVGVVLEMFSEIVKDGSCLLLKAAESTMSQTLQWTLSSIKHASQSTSTQSPVANQGVPERTIGSASAVPIIVTRNDSATYTTVKSDNYSPRGPSIAPVGVGYTTSNFSSATTKQATDTTTESASSSQVRKKWTPDQFGALPFFLDEKLKSTWIDSVIVTPADSTSTTTAQAGPSRTDTSSSPASSTRAASASYSPFGTTSSNLGKTGANAAVGPAVPAGTSSLAEKQWKPGHSGVLPYFADRKLEPRESSSHADPAPVASHPTNQTPSENELGLCDKVSQSTGHTDGSPPDVTVVETHWAPNITIAPVSADPAASTDVPDVRRPAHNTTVKLARYSPFEGRRWGPSKTFAPPGVPRTPSSAAAFKAYPPFESIGSSPAENGTFSAIGPPASTISYFARKPAAYTATKSESYMRSVRKWAPNKMVATFPARSILNSTAVRVEYSTIEMMSSLLDATFEVLLMPFEQTNSSRNGDVVSQSMTPQAVDSQLFEVAKKSSYKASEPSRVATEPSRYYPFQKKWGPSSTVSPAPTATMSKASIPSPIVEASASKKLETEAKQRALLSARLELDQRQKYSTDMEAKQRALLSARLELDDRTEGDRMFTLVDQLSNDQSGLNQLDRPQAQASTMSGIDMNDNEAAVQTSLSAFTDFGRPLESLTSQASQTTSSSSEPSGRDESSTRVEAGASKHNPFQKKWGPSSTVTPAPPDTMSKANIPTPTGESSASDTLLATRLEQDQHRKDRSDTEVNQRALLAAPFELDRQRKDRSGKEAKQRDLLVARLEQDQMQKVWSDTETHYVLDKTEGDRVFTLGDQFSNDQPGLNQPGRPQAQASTTSGIDMNGNKAAVQTSSSVSTDFGRPLESITSQVLQTPSSSSEPSGHDESSTRVEAGATKHYPFQKKWGPSSAVGPAHTDTMSKASIPTPIVNADASKKLETEAKRRALLAARLEQDRRRKDRSDTEANQRALLVPRLEQDRRRKDRSDTEANQRALLVARLEQDRRRKDRSVTETHYVLDKKEDDRVFTLGDQFSNDESGLNKPAFLIANSGRVKPASEVATEVSRYSSFQKNWGPSSAVGPVYSYSLNIAVSATTAPVATISPSVSVANAGTADDLLFKLSVTPPHPTPTVQAKPNVSWKERVMSEATTPTVQAKPNVSWKERVMSEATIRDTLGVYRPKDVVAPKYVVASSTQDERSVAAVPMETKGCDADELVTQESLTSMFITPPDSAPTVQARPNGSWKERVMSEAKFRDALGVDRAKDIVASKHVAASSTQDKSTVSAIPIKTKGFDADEFITQESFPSKLFATPSDPAPTVQAKPNVSWQKRVMSEAKFRDAVGVNSSKDVLASKHGATSSIQGKSTVAAVPIKTKGFVADDSITRESLPSKFFVTPPNPAPTVQVKPNVSWKERVMSEVESQSKPNVSWKERVMSEVESQETFQKQSEQEKPRRERWWRFLPSKARDQLWRREPTELKLDTKVTLKKAEKNQNVKTRRATGSQESESGWSEPKF